MTHLLAEASATVIQVEWQSLAALGSLLGGAIVAAAKILAYQWAANIAFEEKRHEEGRTDAQEARDENRELSKMLLDTGCTRSTAVRPPGPANR